MTWMTWRQHRQQALFALLALAALTALLIPTGRAMHHALTADGLDRCLRTVGPSGPGCSDLVHAFSARFTSLRFVAILLLVVPALVGMFLGPPLVAREVEHGTHRLVWTQGVTRLRWALVKIGLLSALALAIAVGYGVLLEWWMTPLNTVNSSRLEPGLYDMQGIVPIGYTLFAVSLGIFAGTLCRRVVPAMALTVAAFVVTRLGVGLIARPHFVAPLHRRVPVVGGEDPSGHGSYVIGSDLYDAAGRHLTHDSLTLCTPGDASCADKFGSGPLHGAYNLVVYQPDSRFWTFQAIETALFLAFAALLVAVAVRRIRRHVV
jgi:ABC-2 family transporter protein